MIDSENLLSEITKKVTRDDRETFTDTERLDYIMNVLSDSDYEIFGRTPLAVIYKKKGVDLPEKVVLISSHVDCKKEITKPDFNAKEEYYEGTFDNAATNAAAVIAMLENRFADNVLVAFTGDEEKGSRGAKQAIKFLRENDKKAITIALDATFDLESEEDPAFTTYKNASYTIDNLCLNTGENIVRALFDLAKNLNYPFMVTRADDDYDYFSGENEDKTSDYYDALLEVVGTAYEDEAIIYSEKKGCIGAFSLCIPTDDKTYHYYMHSNTLIKIKKKAFAEYIEAVTHISNGLAIL